MFYHDIMHFLKNKYAHIMVNDSHPPIPQVKDNKKGYTTRNIKDLIVQGNSATLLVNRYRKSFMQSIITPLITFQSYEKILEWLRISINLEYLTPKAKQCGARFNIWSLLIYQVFLKQSLLNTRRPLFSLTSRISMKSVSSAPYHGT